MGDFEILEKSKLSEAERMAVERFCWEVRENLEQNLMSITLYGSSARDDYMPGRSDINLLVLTSSLGFSTMQSLLDPIARGLRVGIHPLLMTEADLLSSTDIFPVKFLSMKESHYTLWGEDPLEELSIAREHIRLRCEQELMNLLLRLRRHYVYHGGWNLADKIVGSLTGFMENLRYAMSLDLDQVMDRSQVLASAEKYGIPVAALSRAMALKFEPTPRDEIEKIYEEYLVAVERAARMVDAWGSDKG